jgi:hypothetical protein
VKNSSRLPFNGNLESCSAYDERASPTSPFLRLRAALVQTISLSKIFPTTWTSEAQVWLETPAS